MDLDSGEMVTVKGEEVVRDNGQAVFVAHELHRGEDEWMLKKHHEGHPMM
ncbi:hypothetical protein GF314_00100 [bacterium]|nr:hypothetical protein [bacterium]